MSLLDWNKDGKKNFADDFIEYHIFNANDKNNRRRPDTHRKAGIPTGLSILFAAGVFLAVSALIGAIVKNASNFGNNASVREKSCIMSAEAMNNINEETANQVSSANSVNTINSEESADKEKSAELSTGENNAVGNTDENGSNKAKEKSSLKADSKQKYDSYDEGYEDYFRNGEYDIDRYNSDADYADGADDAMRDAY